VVSRVSAIVIETPVRRRQGERFDPAELRKIIAIARRDGIRLHLDGARMFLESAYSGESVADYSAPFDTSTSRSTSISTRRPGRCWPDRAISSTGCSTPGGCSAAASITRGRFALVALHYLDGFGDRFGRAVRVSETGSAPCGRTSRFTIDRVALGTNLFRMQVRGTDPAAFRKRLETDGVLLAEAQRGTFLIGVNETLNRTTAPARPRRSSGRCDVHSVRLQADPSRFSPGNR
jgi:threonine aldolase